MSQFDTSIVFIFAARPCGMEARGGPWSRTRVNPCTGWIGLGERACQRDARYPTVAGPVVGAAITGHCSPLPQEVCTGPSPRKPRKPRQGDGSVREVNDTRAMPVQKSDHPIVAMKPGNAGGAKGVTS